MNGSPACISIKRMPNMFSDGHHQSQRDCLHSTYYDYRSNGVMLHIPVLCNICHGNINLLDIIPEYYSLTSSVYK